MSRHVNSADINLHNKQSNCWPNKRCRYSFIIINIDYSPIHHPHVSVFLRSATHLLGIKLWYLVILFSDIQATDTSSHSQLSSRSQSRRHRGKFMTLWTISCLVGQQLRTGGVKPLI